MNTKYFAFILVLVAAVGCSKSDDATNSEELDIVSIHSNIVNEDYVLYVYLPSSYDAGIENYPVLYQLDGNSTIGHTIDNAESLVNLKEFIVVAVDYVGENKRDRDFTPTYQDDFSDSGGADSFYSFFESELIPYINSNYRVDTDFGNTLKGHSLGGLFATIALLKHNENAEVFKNYIIESPSLWWDNGLMLNREQQFSEENNDIDAKIYVSVGELEQVIQKIYFEVFQGQILSRNYPSLMSEFEVLHNIVHRGVKDNSKALKYIFGDE